MAKRWERQGILVLTMPPSVKIDAAKTNRSLVNQAPSRPQLQANPVLKFWRWLINSALADAKRTHNGLPTDGAILARWWIEEHKPKQEKREEWERSLDCACGWLGLDAAAERKRLVAEIDEHLRTVYADFVRTSVYLRRAAVLTCAGYPTTVNRQHVLPLVSKLDFEHIAGVDHPDPPRVAVQMGLPTRRASTRVLPQQRAARVTRHRTGGLQKNWEKDFHFHEGRSQR